MFLTKNDFIVSRSCPTKLYYKKNHYPSLLEDNPYLDFLRDGGYMVEAIAKLLFSDGRVLPECEDPHQAFVRRRQLYRLAMEHSSRQRSFTETC